MSLPPLLSSSIREQAPTRMIAGALAHLATHMETGCPRAAYLAAMLLEQVANDGGADTHLRHHARQLVDILERDEIATDVQHSRQDMLVAGHPLRPYLAHQSIENITHPIPS